MPIQWQQADNVLLSADKGLMCASRAADGICCNKLIWGGNQAFLHACLLSMV